VPRNRAQSDAAQFTSRCLILFGSYDCGAVYAVRSRISP
jgi:hypothetical protein